MKITQAPPPFPPVTIVLETLEEVRSVRSALMDTNRVLLGLGDVPVIQVREKLSKILIPFPMNKE